jgi:hypothetical protein
MVLFFTSYHFFHFMKENVEEILTEKRDKEEGYEHIVEDYGRHDISYICNKFG